MTPHSDSSPSSAFLGESSASTHIPLLGGKTLPLGLEKPKTTATLDETPRLGPESSRRGRGHSRGLRVKSGRAGRSNSSNERGFFQPADDGRRLSDDSSPP